MAFTSAYKRASSRAARRRERPPSRSKARGGRAAVRVRINQMVDVRGHCRWVSYPEPIALSTAGSPQVPANAERFHEKYVAGLLQRTSLFRRTMPLRLAQSALEQRFLRETVP